MQTVPKVFKKNIAEDSQKHAISLDPSPDVPQYNRYKPNL